MPMDIPRAPSFASLRTPPTDDMPQTPFDFEPSTRHLVLLPPGPLPPSRPASDAAGSGVVATDPAKWRLPRQWPRSPSSSGNPPFPYPYRKPKKDGWFNFIIHGVISNHSHDPRKVYARVCGVTDGQTPTPSTSGFLSLPVPDSGRLRCRAVRRLRVRRSPGPPLPPHRHHRRHARPLGPPLYMTHPILTHHRFFLCRFPRASSPLWVFVVVRGSKLGGGVGCF